MVAELAGIISDGLDYTACYREQTGALERCGEVAGEPFTASLLPR